MVAPLVGSLAWTWTLTLSPSLLFWPGVWLMLMAELTVQLRDSLTVRCRPVTVTVGTQVPALAAPRATVPVIRPVLALRVRPTGKPTTL